MVIDTSALVAILSAEPSADRLVTAIEADPIHLVSSGTVLEAALVMLGRYGEAGEPMLDRLLLALDVEVVVVDARQLTLARDAAVRFGRGRHKAALNFGDCFSYALAAARGEPLLFVGDDFRATDVEAVSW